MSDKAFTAEEQAAAWAKADVVPGENPERVRVDNVNNSGVILRRDRFESAEAGGWTIDEEGRAREKKYRLRNAMHAAAQNHREAEAVEQQRRREAHKKVAESAGIPNAWELYERLATLESYARTQQQQIQELANLLAQLRRSGL